MSSLSVQILTNIVLQIVMLTSDFFFSLQPMDTSRDLEQLGNSIG